MRGEREREGRHLFGRAAGDYRLSLEFSIKGADMRPFMPLFFPKTV